MSQSPFSIYPILIAILVQWNTHSVIEGLPDPEEAKEEPVYENRSHPQFLCLWIFNIFKCARIKSIGKGLYPSFALLNHR